MRVLPLHVANKIAAGEVVERPASVVKELVENAIDAGASRISVTVTQGGRKLVSVRDDGCGMSRDDAVLSLERQATSKIRDVEDIESIDTLGFRGEAIPSIASVSRFSMSTRRADEDEGTFIQVNAGSIVGEEGHRMRKTAKSLLKMGLADVVASDAHGIKYRKSALAKAYGYVVKKYTEGYAYELFHALPREVVKSVTEKERNVSDERNL